MTDWGDVITRTRGLASHLLRDEQYRALCEAQGIGALGAQLTTLGIVHAPATGVPYDAAALEESLRRRAGARLRVLASWAGERVEQLAPLLDDEDRRSIRALVRGAVAGAAPEARLTGLIPTSSLPLRALQQLATAGDVATVGAQLLTWRHPFASAVAEEAQRQHLDLFHLEVALTRAFAERALRTARRDTAMRRFAERTIDLENLWSVLILADQHADLDPASIFVCGGTLIRADDIAAAQIAGSRFDIAERLRVRVAHTPLAAALTAANRSAEDAAARALEREFRALARTAPLSLAPVVHFVLRQRVELQALLRVTWSIAMHVPPVLIEGALGVAA